MSERKIIKGVTVNLGGEDYVVPPLNLEQLEEHAEDIDKLGNPELTVAEQRQIQLTLAVAAMKRNYPEMTVEKAKQIIDLGNLIELAGAVMGVSGFAAGGPPPRE